jgi:two-component system, chemotaxis family, protein-glutamate methylesterase/glutaminase
MSLRDIEVLVVDDSAVCRQMMIAALEDARGFSVSTAADPIFARERMKKKRQDVMLLDLEIPREDGLSFLKELVASGEVPVVIWSSHVAEGTARAMEALAAGAVDLVAKPSSGVREFIEQSGPRIAEVLRVAARSRVRASLIPLAPRSPTPPPVGALGDHVLLVGASMGGPEALARIFGALPRDCPPALVVQHMPAQFMPGFVSYLQKTQRQRVVSATDGAPLVRGTIAIAPGDRHLELARRDGRLVMQLSDAPPMSRHRPSVDVLFESAARLRDLRAVAALLTGMGVDGAKGLLALHQAGVRTLAQDEPSSVVWGMPAAAVKLGAASQVGDLPTIARALVEGPLPRR